MDIYERREIETDQVTIDRNATEDELHAAAEEMAAGIMRKIEEDHLKSLREAMQEYLQNLARHKTDPAEETEPAPYQYRFY